MIIYVLCIVLFLVGLYGVLVKRNLLKIIIGLALIEYSVNLFLVLIGYVKKGEIPIISEGIKNSNFVDPLPQALVLTAIVIGVATTALILSSAVVLYKKYGTFNVKKINQLKG